MPAKSDQRTAQPDTARRASSPRSRFRWRAPDPLTWLYLFLSFLLLRSKLFVTPAWYDGTLERNHEALLAFQYTNNEQSRLLQFYIPEGFIQIFGLSVPHAYLLQRWLFTALAFILFFHYLRRWFSRELSFASVCLLAALLPFSFLNDLQESAPLLLATFVGGLWVIRDGATWQIALVLLVGAMNNETMLALPLVYFIDQWRGWKVRAVLSVAGRTAVVATPAFLYTGWIRYVTRDRPHLGGAMHWKDNVAGIITELRANVFDYPWALYLSIFFIFNVLWVLAFYRPREKPRFIRSTLFVVPAFVIPHLVTGIISEVRQMTPLAFVLIPAAFFWLFRERETGTE